MRRKKRYLIVTRIKINKWKNKLNLECMPTEK